MVIIAKIQSRALQVIVITIVKENKVVIETYEMMKLLKSKIMFCLGAVEDFLQLTQSQNAAFKSLISQLERIQQQHADGSLPNVTNMSLL